MSSYDARVQEIEVLHHFSSSISRVGGDIASAASRISGAAYQELGEFKSLLHTIEGNLEKARNEYADALSEWEEGKDAYAEQTLNIARERLNTAQENYEEGVVICQLVETLLMNAVSFSGSFNQLILSQTDRASDNVRLAASRLQEYLNH